MAFLNLTNDAFDLAPTLWNNKQDSKDGELAALIRLHSMPLTYAEKVALSHNNNTLDIEAQLDIMAPRPDYEVNYSNILYHLEYGEVYVPGLAKKRQEIDMLSKGNALDYIIQQHFDYLVQVLSANDASLVHIALETIASFYNSKAAAFFHYAREVIFQRSLFNGQAIDMGMLMLEHNVINSDRFGGMPALSLPKASKKLAAYAARLKLKAA